MLSISNISLEVTKRCTNACEYCYWGSKNADREYVKDKDCTLEYAKQVLNWLVSPEISGDIKRVSVSLFGGEPLLRFDLIKEIVTYAKTIATKKIGFGITSNGVLLNKEIMDFLIENNIKIDPYSIDGDKETNDTHRKLANGQGSFDKMISYLPEFLKRQKGNVARMTITPVTCNKMFQNVKYIIEELGFEYIAPSLVSDSPDEVGVLANWDENSLKELDKQYSLLEQWISERIEKKVPNAICIGYLQKNISYILNKSPMQSPCGAGRGYLGISMDGIFPCHRFTNWPEWKLGEIKDKDKLDFEKINKFRQYKRDISSPSCKGCPNYFCGGNCFAANYAYSKDIYKTNPTICKANVFLQRTAENLIKKYKNNPYFTQLVKGFSGVGNRRFSNSNINKRGNFVINQENYLLNQRVALLEQRISVIEQRLNLNNLQNRNFEPTDIRVNKQPCPGCPKGEDKK